MKIRFLLDKLDKLKSFLSGKSRVFSCFRKKQQAAKRIDFMAFHDSCVFTAAKDLIMQKGIKRKDITPETIPLHFHQLRVLFTEKDFADLASRIYREENSKLISLALLEVEGDVSVRKKASAVLENAFGSNPDELPMAKPDQRVSILKYTLGTKNAAKFVGAFNELHSHLHIARLRANNAQKWNMNLAVARERN